MHIRIRAVLLQRFQGQMAEVNTAEPDTFDENGGLHWDVAAESQAPTAGILLSVMQGTALCRILQVVGSSVP